MTCRKSNIILSFNSCKKQKQLFDITFISLCARERLRFSDRSNNSIYFQTLLQRSPKRRGGRGDGREPLLINNDSVNILDYAIPSLWMDRKNKKRETNREKKERWLEILNWDSTRELRRDFAFHARNSHERRPRIISSEPRWENPENEVAPRAVRVLPFKDQGFWCSALEARPLTVQAKLPRRSS